MAGIGVALGEVVGTGKEKSGLRVALASCAAEWIGAGKVEVTGFACATASGIDVRLAETLACVLK